MGRSPKCRFRPVATSAGSKRRPLRRRAVVAASLLSGLIVLVPAAATVLLPATPAEASGGVGFPPMLYGVSCPTSAVCFAVGEAAGYETSGPLVVAQSTDGGDFWLAEELSGL